MYISKTLIPSFFSNLVGCDADSPCTDGGFCNFEDGVAGYCEYCSQLEEHCDTSGFNEQGEVECKATCEG